MPRLDRRDWLDGAMAMLAAGGVGDVKVEPLAKRLGVTKGSFYWHFEDRPALLRAILDHWAEHDTERVIEVVADGSGSSDATAASGPTDRTDHDPSRPPGSPGEALHRLMEITIGHRSELDGVEAAIREWAATDEEAAAVSRAVDERRLSYVAGLIEAAGVSAAEAEQRAHLLYRVVIGEYTWRRYDGPSLSTGSVGRLIDHLLEPDR